MQESYWNENSNHLKNEIFSSLHTPPNMIQHALELVKLGAEEGEIV
jgi:hypothetical protein